MEMEQEEAEEREAREIARRERITMGPRGTGSPDQTSGGGRRRSGEGISKRNYGYILKSDDWSQSRIWEFLSISLLDQSQEV